ncbi:MAG: flagellar protein [Sphingomonas bacterium]|nr:flagella basal body P-ring formation protein FlgA [Sphingomonas bacterium]MDB5690109.1 flagellar protein [Sphingomonas bacterium]
MKRYIFVVLLLTAASISAAIPGFQDLDALDRKVAVSLGADIGQPGGAANAIDRRLRLAPCAAAEVEPAVAGAVTVRCPSLGWRLRVPLVRGGSAGAAGRTATRARAEPVVRRGDPVEMLVATGAFTVSLQAIAEQDGAPGDRIRVRADAKSPPRIAEVVDAGQVRIPGFK